MKDITNRTFFITSEEVIKALGIKLNKKEYIDFFFKRENDDMLVIGITDYEEE